MLRKHFDPLNSIHNSHSLPTSSTDPKSINHNSTKKKVEPSTLTPCPTLNDIGDHMLVLLLNGAEIKT